jgi:hypothetical protein
MVDYKQLTVGSVIGSAVLLHLRFAFLAVAWTVYGTLIVLVMDQTRGLIFVSLRTFLRTLLYSTLLYFAQESSELSGQ